MLLHYSILMPGIMIFSDFFLVIFSNCKICVFLVWKISQIPMKMYRKKWERNNEKYSDNTKICNSKNVMIWFYLLPFSQVSRKISWLVGFFFVFDFCKTLNLVRVSITVDIWYLNWKLFFDSLHIFFFVHFKFQIFFLIKHNTKTCFYLIKCQYFTSELSFSSKILKSYDYITQWHKI